MRVAIIGASGAMGSFFVRYFSGRGASVVGSDPRRLIQRGMRYARSNKEAVREADVVILATPSKETLTISRSFSSGLKEDSTVVEISTVKGRLPKQLAGELTPMGVEVLSVHPMFGPSLKTSKEMRIAVITDVGNHPTRRARKIFPDARLLPLATDDHDRLMAIILSVTHAMNIAYVDAVTEAVSIDEFRRFASPISLVQANLAAGVLSQDPELAASVQFTNRFSVGAVKRALTALQRLSSALDSGDVEGFKADFRRLSRNVSADEESLGAVYEAYEAMTRKHARKPRAILHGT